MPSKHLHIIGISGVATSAIAIAFHKAGWKVTGSDKGFFPPVSTALLEAGISFYAGWHPQKMTENGMPDIVMIGGSGKSSVNPEMVFAKEQGIEIRSYPQMLEEYFLREHSIVCAGTMGKTSATALLACIFEKAGLDPTYMFGGISLSQKESAHITPGKWSILEGDEYTGAQFDDTAKFLHYRPTHLLLTSISWDHADVYPTPESYFEAFKKLISKIPKDGLLVVSSDSNKAMEITRAHAKATTIITYGKNTGNYVYEDVQGGLSGLSFVIKHEGIAYPIRSLMLGAFQAENITGCFAMAAECGIPKETIIRAISEFKGIKRRLEKRYEGSITIIDDIAHSPEKVSPPLQTLKETFAGNIFAIFEPNIGGRERSSAEKYNHAFRDAYEVIIPRLSPLKTNQTSQEKPIEGDELAAILSKTHPKARYIEDDEEIIRYLKENVKHGDCIVFLGSHGFRGMISDLVDFYSKKSAWLTIISSQK